MLLNNLLYDGFNKKLISEFLSFKRHDIMNIAAYRQYNSRIPQRVTCCIKLDIEK